MEEGTNIRLRDSSCTHLRLTGKPVGLFSFVGHPLHIFLFCTLGVFFSQ
jgi:hypothetical protein